MLLDGRYEKSTKGLRRLFEFSIRTNKNNNNNQKKKTQNTMSSPPPLAISLDSSPSSSVHSDHSSSTNSIAENNRGNSKKLKRKRKQKKKPNDKYLVTANEWIPIAGAPVSKSRKKSIKPSTSFPQVTLDPVTNEKLVKLFEPSPATTKTTAEPGVTTQKDQEEVEQPILVTIEQKVDLYVNCFEEMLDTVLRYEHFLFLPSELGILSSWQALPRSSKYLFVRLFMRKHDKYFRLSKLSNYEADIGNIPEACVPLCKPVEELLAEIPIERVDPPRPEHNPFDGGGMMEEILHPGQNSGLGSPEITFLPNLEQYDSSGVGRMDYTQQVPQDDPGIPFDNQFLIGSSTSSVTFDPHVNSYNACQGINEDQFLGQGLGLDLYTEAQIIQYARSPTPPPLNFDSLNNQSNKYEAMDDLQYVNDGVQHNAEMSMTDLIRSSPTGEPDPLNLFGNPHQAAYNFQHTGDEDLVSIDELLRTNAHDLGLLEGLTGPYGSDIMNDIQLACQGHFVSHPLTSSSNQLSFPAAITTNLQLGDPESIPYSPVNSLNTDEGIMGQLQDNCMNSNDDHAKKWSEAANSLLGCMDQALDIYGIDDGDDDEYDQLDDSPELEWLPFDANDSMTLPRDIPPIPPPVDIRPISIPKPPDPISTTPFTSPPRSPLLIHNTNPPLPLVQNKRDHVLPSIENPEYRVPLVETENHIPLPVAEIQRDQVPSMEHSNYQVPLVEHKKDSKLRSFASMTSEDVTELDTDELFGCMQLDELTNLAKKLNANPHTTKDMIIASIKAATRKQSTLCGATTTDSKGKRTKELKLKYTKTGLKESQILSLNSRILRIIGPAIKLRPEVCSLFKRLHLIFYRSTTMSESTMTASMLSKMGIRNYPIYSVIRTDSIFESREQLIKYEEALDLEKRFDELLVNERRAWNEDNQAKIRRQDAKTLRLNKALDLFESAWIDWQETVLEEDERLDLIRTCEEFFDPDFEQKNYYKRRFHQGWPLTRILQKGLAVLARFKEHVRETAVLEALIQQRHFRRGKRGQWYDRLALVLMTHLAGNESATDEERRLHQASALYTCEHGLEDPDTHQLYRFSLARRQAKLHALDGLHDPSINLELQQQVEDWKSASKVTIHRSILSDRRETGIKTLWISPVDNSTLTVEEIALEHYLDPDSDWRGFHSETGILKMIFALVFWDIIFAPIPGAFETAFQTAPLDIATDAFEIARRPMIEERMRSIHENGNEEIQRRLEETYRREFERKTWSIGITHSSWDRYRLEDLLEIVAFFGTLDKRDVSSSKLKDQVISYQSNKKYVHLFSISSTLPLLYPFKNWFSLLLKAKGIEVEICSVKEE
ncbi:hypothetical protein PSTT_05877 [Puccinia striiformis]|uniref:Fanconi-associated nuclease n=1 Tax=Puccinia striiformis TaxID=27350 RepID=A0A2S4VME8_9BASI|nr:hypothetical protein PSTT_05877 [Puccinia striiformis]